MHPNFQVTHFVAFRQSAGSAFLTMPSLIRTHDMQTTPPHETLHQWITRKTALLHARAKTKPAQFPEEHSSTDACSTNAKTVARLWSLAETGSSNWQQLSLYTRQLHEQQDSNVREAHTSRDGSNTYCLANCPPFSAVAPEKRSQPGDRRVQ